MRLWSTIRALLAGSRAHLAAPTATAPPALSGPASNEPNPGPALQPRIQRLLPLRWSLSYALTEKQWRGIRDRHRQLFPDQTRCACPNGCPANALDEEWRYDHDTFTKTFLAARFICPGCHWLKTPPWRIKTWLELDQGLVRPKTKPPHITDCLGWTQTRVDDLRRADLAEHQHQQAARLELVARLVKREAIAARAPIEQLPQNERDTFLASAQILIVPWQVDLSNLTRYGYTPTEIAEFETRMYRVAAKRLAGPTTKAP